MITNLKALVWFFFILVLFNTSPLLGQFNTFYSTRTIDFFEEEEELEGLEVFKLIPNTDVYLSFNTGFKFVSEKNNFNLINNAINSLLDTLNAAQSNPSEQYEKFDENSVIPYHLGISLDVFLFKYYGFGFTYSRNNYYSHKTAISKKSSTYSEHYNKTKSYEMINQGNHFSFTLLGRYPFGKRTDYNIYFVGGAGYNYSTSKLKVNFEDKVDNINTNQEYKSTSHGFHFLTEFVFKINYFHINAGLLLDAITFDKYDLPSDSLFSPEKFQSIKLGPTLYIKTGFNF